MRIIVNMFKLECKSTQLQLLGTLNGGQSFRWKKRESNGVDHWIGVFANRVWCLNQKEDCILYDVHEPESGKVEEENVYNEILKDYFHLNTNLEKHYSEWSSRDVYFKKAATKFYGIRILKQDPVENIFSFICSQNNHISRISGMVEKLASLFGNFICELHGERYYSFPNIEALTKDDIEHTLRKNSFGYRAKYINDSAQFISRHGGENWISSLKQMDYESAKKALLMLPGIGPKVADCICLMSLDHLQSVPVDTHVYQIAKRFYMPNLPQNKTVTNKIYNEIGDHFRELYGPLAGWAHTVLFCADLKKFQNNDEEGENKSLNKKRKK